MCALCASSAYSALSITLARRRPRHFVTDTARSSNGNRLTQEKERESDYGKADRVPAVLLSVAVTYQLIGISSRQDLARSKHSSIVNSS